MTFLVRPATDADWPLIWPIIQEVAASQETFAMKAAPNERVLRASWMTQHSGRAVLASDEEGQVLGTANMYANRPNQGSHVASGSFLVAASARGHGVGRALVRDMIDWTTKKGFLGIQFNAVVSSNEGALRLYESEGFRIIGAAPRGFFTPHGVPWISSSFGATCPDAPHALAASRTSFTLTRPGRSIVPMTRVS